MCGDEVRRSSPAFPATVLCPACCTVREGDRAHLPSVSPLLLKLTEVPFALRRSPLPTFISVGSAFALEEMRRGSLHFPPRCCARPAARHGMVFQLTCRVSHRYRCTSLTIKRTPLGPYCRPMSRVLEEMRCEAARCGAVALHFPPRCCARPAARRGGVFEAVRPPLQYVTRMCSWDYEET